MLIVIAACLALVLLTTLIHYEVLTFLNSRLAVLHIPSRMKLLVAMVAMFFAHAIEIAVYGGAVYWMVEEMKLGVLEGANQVSFLTCFYFSAETYTSLGFGDLTPTGPIRLVAGVEALNGLLLIAWSASYTYLAMERYWGRA